MITAKIRCTVFSLFMTIGTLQAQIQLPAIFSDHMVLQQNSEAKIWGWGNSAETILIIPQWAPGDTIKTRVNNQGQWEAKIKTSIAGGPYTLKIANKKQTVELKNVMLGEVWLCSGQSNMEWSVNHGIKNGEQEAKEADYNNLRIFHLPKQGANTPQNNCRGLWEESSPESMRKTSAIGYFFGRYLSEKLNVPIGIIVSAWGGTTAEVWTPREVVEQDNLLSQNKYNDTPWKPKNPGILYNQMINPVMPFQIAGCIWYQGESNHEYASNYGLLMEKMIESWRKGFGSNFPFYFVQIAPFKYNSAENTPALLREQQEEVARRVPYTALINISDLVENVNDIHPRDKRNAGERLANLALGKTYKKKTGAYYCPTFSSSETVKDKIIIYFNDKESKPICKEKIIIGLTICGSDKKYVKAEGKLKGNRLIVWSPQIKAPKAVRYCFDDATIGNLRSEEGMPILPFRTNNAY